MTPAELIAAVRRKLGNVTSQNEVTDTNVTDEGTWILRRIAEKVTTKMLRYVTSKEDERDYSVHENTVRVQKVFVWDGIDEDLMILGSPIINETESNEFYNFPSLWAIRMARKKRGLPKIKFTYNPQEKKIKLDSYPEEADKRIYYISIERVNFTLANLPEDFEELLVTGTSWKMLEVLALKRSRLGGIQRQGGFVDYPEARLRPFIDEYKDEFYDQLRLKAALYHR